jgi:Zn-finger nucleic acid-binding protein
MAIVLPAECVDHHVDMAPDARGGGVWVQHGTLSRLFKSDDQDGMKAWIDELHAAEKPEASVDPDP